MDRTGLRNLFTETRSVTAVEFAIIAPVLFLFLFSIMLVGIVQFWQLTLDDAVRNATRQVIIGAASSTTGIHNGTDLITAICNEFGSAAPNCPTTLQYSVQGAATFTGSGGITPATLSAAGVLTPNATFMGITISSPVLVQAAYKVPISIPLVPMTLVTLNGTPSIISASAMVTEP